MAVRSPAAWRCHFEVAIGADDSQAALLHRAQMRAASEQHDVRAGLREPGADVAADGPRANDDDFHDAFWVYSLGDHTALNLARRRARNGVGDVDLLWPLVISQPLLAVRQELAFGHVLSNDDGCGDFFSPGLMRNTETHGFGHRRMGQQHFVDLSWRDLFAATVDELFDARHERQISLLVEKSLIARAEPAIDERLRIRFRIVLVSAE